MRCSLHQNPKMLRRRPSGLSGCRQQCYSDSGPRRPELELHQGDAAGIHQAHIRFRQPGPSRPGQFAEQAYADLDLSVYDDVQARMGELHGRFSELDEPPEQWIEG